MKLAPAIAAPNAITVHTAAGAPERAHGAHLPESPFTWTGRPLATMELSFDDGTHASITGDCDYRFTSAGTTLDAALSLAHTRAARWLTENGRTFHPAQAVLQASDGEYWVTALTAHNYDDGFVHLPGEAASGAHISSVDSSRVREALKAIVSDSVTHRF